MKFYTAFTRLLIILFFICFIIIIYIFDIFSYVTYIQHEYGFSEVTDEYILPKVHENFISKEEADYILEKAKGKFEPSHVGGGVNKNIRNSYTAWISKYNRVVKKVVKRVCDMEGYPFKNAEHLQVVRYRPNEFYKKHFDTQNSNEDGGRFFGVGGHRVITMLIYLNDEFEEGATRFTLLKRDIKPPKYSGILFHSLGKTNKKCHPYSRHAGLPVKSGEKYVANVWVRQNKFSQCPFSSFDPYYYNIKRALEIGYGSMNETVNNQIDDNDTK